MSKEHFQQVSVDIDGAEVMIDVQYRYAPGTPEQGPSYASGGQPAEGPEIEITGMSVRTKEWPQGLAVPNWFFDAVLAGEKALEWLYEHHDGDEDDGSDYAYDRARDERMERDNAD